MNTRSIGWTSFIALALIGCKKEETQNIVYEALPIERRNIVVTTEAPGTIEPDTLVEVKSKAGGEIIAMYVSTGDKVKIGQKLVKIDRRSALNAFEQAVADTIVAAARLENAKAEKARADKLLASESISEQEHQAKALDVANATAAYKSAKINLQNAGITLQDTEIEAPISGTIITKAVERGQVIQSVSRDVGAGTALLTMADLNLVQVRTLIDEVDFGKIRPGLRATVTVEAFPNQTFEGEVFKTEPQAETEQNVTKFPVRIRINNESGKLLPGMNAKVLIHIGRRDSVLAVSNAALRTDRDAASAASVLGISDAQFQEMLKLAQAERDSNAAKLANRGGNGQGREGGNGPGRQGGNGPAGSGAATGGNATTASAQNPAGGPSREKVMELFTKQRNGEKLTAEEQKILQQAREAFQRGGGGRRAQRDDNNFQFGGNYIVFVVRNGQPKPVYVRTGLTDLDYSEVVTGLTDKDSVLVLPSASLVRQQDQFRQWRTRMGGSGIPGIGSTNASTGNRAGGGNRGGAATAGR